MDDNNILKIGDTVYCTDDLKYMFKDIEKVINSGYPLIIKQITNSKYVLDRFGKLFIVDKDKIKKK